MYFTYVLYSHKFDRIYIGHTNNLIYRLKRHNDGLVKSTKAYRPWKIIYQEKFPNRAVAMQREKELKSHKGRDFIRNLLNSTLSKN
jgi:putative endonuclease